MDQSLQTVLAAALGFLAKSIWDRYWKVREDRESLARSKRIEFLERQLSGFYWPLYLRLQINNVIWDHLVAGVEPRDNRQAHVHEELLSSFFLPNHEAMLRIIEGNAHLAQPDRELSNQLLRFIRHITIYKTIRGAGLSFDPIAVGEPWPAEFFPLLEQRLQIMQAEYDREIGRAAA